ncbi:hypothetical protein [Pontimicrobium sp. SW4]|uniref:Uncharacterized protein n=1 Tax=Pontimicrobium sp. SW4 TaxID=3153519 RepID=A0AAU7BXA3_9FLAO
MGYMGFGMQRWVYSRNPKKPFVKGRIPSFSTTDSYDRKFKLQPSKQYDSFYIIISILLISLFFSVIYSKKDAFLIHSNEVNNQKKEIFKYRDKEAFIFLMKSGKHRLESGNIIGAYYEFKLANNIKPNDAYLKQITIETLSILCSRNEKYCKELDVFMKKE